ncbi:ADP-ribosylation factor-like protein 2 [Dissostichus eleginoides]|uniref:ADP-ribosylation factor-like protein 2 n=1 Tax=Dissostichus eleginoides TaxID=100907 RepID=A0AAD9BYV9_DISEL|nr:ADP-ribosylation factor-like protein 2 [Dissostichus eleginoides]
MIPSVNSSVGRIQVWVVDSADRLRLEDCRKELSSLLLEERLAGATLLVFANKQDLPGALSKEAIQVALALDDIKSHHWCIIGCSAVTGKNVHFFFICINSCLMFKV